MPSMDMLLNYLQGVDGRARLPATCLANNVYPQVRMCRVSATVPLQALSLAGRWQRGIPCFCHLPAHTMYGAALSIAPAAAASATPAPAAAPAATASSCCSCLRPSLAAFRILPLPASAAPLLLLLQSWLDDSSIETAYVNRPPYNPWGARGYFNRLPLPATCNYDSWVAGRGCAFSYTDPNTGLNLQVRCR